jgi:hypothetical protein
VFPALSKRSHRQTREPQFIKQIENVKENGVSMIQQKKTSSKRPPTLSFHYLTHFFSFFQFIQNFWQ